MTDNLYDELSGRLSEAKKLKKEIDEADDFISYLQRPCNTIRIDLWTGNSDIDTSSVQPRDSKDKKSFLFSSKNARKYLINLFMEFIDKLDDDYSKL